MAPTSRLPEPNGDGVRVTDPPGLRRAASVLVLVAIVVGLGTFLVISLIRHGVPPKGPGVETTPPRESGDGAGGGAAKPASDAPRVATARPHAVRHATPPTRDAAPTAGVAPAPTATEPREVSAKDVIETLNAGGVHTGIAAFSPPGTKPVKRGIVVPDDFELPEGYVRHYQATDDGKQLPPILTLHPDFDLVDAQGEPVAIGDDRVVPPEMAPAGLPVRLLDVPDAPGAPGRRN